jgi:ribosomal protein S12 methylthiotransferase accessory factor
MSEAAGTLTVAVLGTGLLARATTACLTAQGISVRTGAPAEPQAGVDAVVAVSDGWAATPAPAGTGPAVPWLPIRVEFGTAIVGPTVEPGTGCLDCFESRRRAAHDEAAQRDVLHRAHAERLAASPSRWLTGPGAHAVAELASAEVIAAARGQRRRRTRNATVHIRLGNLSVNRHRFLPDPSCARCGRMPHDTAELARLTLWSRPKPAPDTYRVTNLVNREKDLGDIYVDRECGLVRRLENRPGGSYPNVTAPFGMSGATFVEMGYGRELNSQSARLTAIAEALERYGGIRPGGRRTVVRGCFRDLAGHALDPRLLGLYPEQRYATAGFPFRRYHEDLEFSWVWAYSFRHGRPLLVPEAYAYYRPHLFGGDQPFVYEVSNGCALGGCLEEAVLHGILELVERDAFLMTWYGRLPVPRLDLGSAPDRTIPLMAERIGYDTGYRVSAYDTTMEHGIPSVWVMAVHPRDDPAQAKALCAAGAGFNPQAALRNALLELAPMIPAQRAAYRDDVDRVARMVGDGDLVTTMHDHSLLYCHPDAFGRLEFLTGSGRLQPIATTAARAFRPRHEDLRDDLHATVGRFLDLGLDVIVVDQTTPEHRVGGFRCVKVIIPGLVPMTFGHRARRVDGLPRLHEVSRLLGYRDGCTGPGELNPFPHPFP